MELLVGAEIVMKVVNAFLGRNDRKRELEIQALENYIIPMDHCFEEWKEKCTTEYGTDCSDYDKVICFRMIYKSDEFKNIRDRAYYLYPTLEKQYNDFFKTFDEYLQYMRINNTTDDEDSECLQAINKIDESLKLAKRTFGRL